MYILRLVLLDFRRNPSWGAPSALPLTPEHSLTVATFMEQFPVPQLLVTNPSGTGELRTLHPILFSKSSILLEPFTAVTQSSMGILGATIV